MKLDAVMWPDGPWSTVRDEWQHAESIGVNAGWIYDHLNLGERVVWHEAHTTLAAVAATTSTIGMGTMVTSPNFRHPATSAKAALTLAEISNGRFTLGIGAGGPGVDSDAFGGEPLTRAQRTARFAEWVALARDVLHEPSVDRAGEYFTAHDVAVGGSANSRVSIAVAATGRRGMEVAVEFADLWITQDISQDPKLYAGTPHAEVRRQLDILDEACAAAGRDPATLGRLAVLGYGEERPLASIEAFRDCVGRYGALGIDTIAVLWPRGSHAAAQLAVLEQAAAELRA